MLTKRGSLTFLIILATVLAGCTQQGGTTIAPSGPGVVVSCDSTSITGLSTDTSPANGDDTCEVFVTISPLNREQICSGYATIEGSGIVPCDGLSDLDSSSELQVQADFYEPRTTNRIGSDSSREYWEPQDDEEE